MLFVPLANGGEDEVFSGWRERGCYRFDRSHPLGFGEPVAGHLLVVLEATALDPRGKEGWVANCVANASPSYNPRHHRSANPNY